MHALRRLRRWLSRPIVRGLLLLAALMAPALVAQSFTQPQPRARLKKEWSLLSFSADGRLLAVMDERLRPIVSPLLWDTEQNRQVKAADREALTASLRGFHHPVLSADGRLAMLSTNKYDPVWVWDMLTGDETLELGEIEQNQFHFGPSVLFTPQADAVVYTSQRGEIVIRDLATERPRAKLAGQKPLTLSPDGETLATAAPPNEDGESNGEIKLWSMASGEELATLVGHSLQIASLAFTPDGSRLVSGSIPNDDEAADLIVWDVGGRQLLGRTTCRGAHSLLVSGDGATVRTTQLLPTEIELWDINSSPPKKLAQLDARNDIAPNGKLLATVMPRRDSQANKLVLDDKVQLLRLPDLSPAGEVALPWSINLLRRAQFTPNGQWLVLTGGPRQFARSQWAHTRWVEQVWCDPATGEIVARLEQPHIETLTTESATDNRPRYVPFEAVWSADGAKLATRTREGAENVVCLWDAPPRRNNAPWMIYGLWAAVVTACAIYFWSRLRKRSPNEATPALP